MRIAFITPEYVTESNFDGGLANYLRRVCVSLKELGHQPMVIVGSDREETKEQEGVQIFCVDVRSRLLGWFDLLSRGCLAQPAHWIYQSWKMNQKLRQIHNRQKIDIAQFASYKATALFRSKSIPAIIRISSLQFLSDHAYGIRKNLKRAMLHWLELKSLRTVDRLIGPGRNIALAVEQAVGKHVTIIESPYVPNPEIPDSQPYKDQLEGKRYLLFFGAIGLLKGVKTIAAIIGTLLARNRDLFFVFVGKDFGYMGKPMMDYVWRLAGPNRDRVLYLSPMRQQQLEPIIKQAEAVVLPSRIDNFPNTCIEAMAYGKIVIGTKNTSFEQLIEDGRSGFLFEIDNEKALLAMIEKTLNLTDDEKKRIGTRAKERIDLLKPEIVVRQLLKVYQEVIRGPINNHMYME
ncbi:MAG: glycosyltransferase family 4 protein [Desulfobacterales bacterium]|nr:glycosyltransferase family 4 protein [Desulfobacterales bacterium]